MSTYVRILAYATKHWRHLSLSILFTLIYALLNGASVYLSIPLLDTLFQESNNKTLVENVKPTKVESLQKNVPALNFMEQIQKNISDYVKSVVFVDPNNKRDSLFRICIAIFLAFMFKNIAGFMQAYHLLYVEQGMMRELRNDCYKYLQKLPMSYFKNERVGNLISIIMNDVMVVQNSISATFLNMIREPLSIIVFLGIAFSISWRLTLLALIILPFSVTIIAYIGLKLRKQSTIIQEKVADLTSVIQETVSGVKIVKAFGMEDYENKKFEIHTLKFFKLMLRLTKFRNLSSPTTEVLSVLIGVFIIYYGGNLVFDVPQTLKASEFLGVLFSIFQIMTPIKELSSVNNRIQESSAAGDRIFEIIDTDPAINDIENASSLPSFNQSIKFENVSFHYEDSEDLVLDNVDFEVKKGEIFALVGPSGGGKSTLVDLIPRFYDSTGGKIIIDGKDIKEVKLKDLRMNIGIVTQETILFNESIKNNIAYGLEDYPLEKVIEAAKIANAHNFIMELPNGYMTNIGERGVKLSGGQRQRLAIARALLKDPEIMIFDEATSALDNESEKLVQEAIERLMQNRTVFVIAHRLSTVRNASKIIVLEKGKIVQTGRHDELINEQGGLYKKFYDMQFSD